MSTTLRQKKEALKSWIDLTLDESIYPEIAGRTLTVMHEMSGGPKPDGEFVMFSSPTKTESYCPPWVEYSGTSTYVEKHTDYCTVSVRINVFAADGAEILNLLALSPGIYRCHQALSVGDLVFIGSTNPQFIQAFGDTKAEPRYNATFRFRTEVNVTVESDRLDTVSISGEFVQPDESIDTYETVIDLT